MRDGPCIFIERNDTDVEIKTARPDEFQQSLERRLDESALDPGHGRLRDSGELGQASLTEPGTQPALPEDLTSIHASEYTLYVSV